MRVYLSAGNEFGWGGGENGIADNIRTSKK